MLCIVNVVIAVVTSFCLFLIDFDDTVNFSDEPEARHETNRSGQQEKKEYHDECVPKVQERRCSIFDC